MNLNATRRALSVLAVSAAVAASTTAPGHAAGGCELAKASGLTVLNPATGAFEGTATFEIGGVEQTARSSTVVLASEERGAVTFLTTSHTFTFADGRVLRTIDNARLIPTPEPGVYRLVSNLDIVSGGSGFLAGPGGTIDFRGLPHADWETTGQICG